MVQRGMTGRDDWLRLRLRRLFASLERYDLLLAVIPLALTLAVATAKVLGVPVEAALLGGGTIGVLAMVDALFVRPPRGLEGA